ncbi:hypothetical protein [Fervidobacterium sp.]
MRWSLAFVPFAGLVLGQLTNFGNMPITQGGVITQSQLESLMRTPGTLHLLTPEATNWSFYLANLHQSVGSAYVYVTKPEARRLCTLANGNYGGNYAIVRVVPTEERPQPVAFILPPRDGNLKGILFEGEGIYREMALLNLPDPLYAWYNLVGPKVGRAYVYGSPSAGNLRAQVYLRETVWVQDSYPSLIGSYSFAVPWNATLEVNLGRGTETLRVQGYNASTNYTGQQLRVVDASGQDVGYVVITSQVQRVAVGVSDQIVRSGDRCGDLWASGGWFTADLGDGPETFILRNYYEWREGWFGALLRGGADIYDTAGRLRGVARSGGGRTYYGYLNVFGANWCWFGTGYNWEIYRLRYETQKVSESVTLYARRWRQTTREVYKGDFPVMPGGRVVVDGETYSIPELAGYLNSSSVTLKYAKDSPLISYLARQIGLEEGSLINNRLLAGVSTPPERPKPLSVFCQNPR